MDKAELFELFREFIKENVTIQNNYREQCYELLMKEDDSPGSNIVVGSIPYPEAERQRNYWD